MKRNREQQKGKTRDLFKKTGDTKGILHAKIGTIKDRNGKDLTEAEEIKKRLQEYRKKTVSVQFSCLVVSNSLQPHEPQHTRPPCPSPTPRVYSHSCPLSQWCHPIISSSVIPFSSCLQSFPATESFPMSQLFASGGQSIGVSTSASVLPMNIQDWFPLGWTVPSLHGK